MRKLLGVTAAVAILVPASAMAQMPMERPHLGVQASYGNDSNFGIGARLKYSLRGLFPTLPLSGTASAELAFPGSGVKWIDLNYNVTYAFHIPTAPRVTPYAGAGLNFAYLTGSGVSTGKIGVNVLGGTTFASGGQLTPFVELRGVVGDASQLVLTGGLLF